MKPKLIRNGLLTPVSCGFQPHIIIEHETKFHASLNDERVKARIDKRIDRAKYGNFGDWKTEAGEVRAMKIDYGPGYRLYYCLKDNKIIVLLCGGDKRSQQADIKKAATLAREV